MNKLFSFTILLCILTFLLHGITFSQNQQADTHTVQQGETLFSISRMYDISVNELRTWNDLSNSSLQTGQTLTISSPAGSGSVTHIVKPEESLFGISRMYDVTIAEIQQWNNLSGTSIEIGNRLVIYPSESSTPSETEELPPSISELEQMDDEERTSIVRRIEDSATGSDTYMVRSGDNLTQIARRFDMSVNDLRALNGLQNDMLRVGQQLTVKRIQTPPSIAQGAEDSTPQGKFASYRVQSGENLRSILSRFHMSESEFSALNPNINSSSVSTGQQITVLLPPTRNYKNPFQKDADLEDLGTVSVSTYRADDDTSPTSSGELYNPNQLTAAHSNIVIGSVIYVENPATKSGVFVRINDRYSGDGLKLSQKAFEMLSFSSIEQPQVTIYLDQ